MAEMNMPTMLSVVTDLDTTSAAIMRKHKTTTMPVRPVKTARKKQEGFAAYDLGAHAIRTKATISSVGSGGQDHSTAPGTPSWHNCAFDGNVSERKRFESSGDKKEDDKHLFEDCLAFVASLSYGEEIEGTQ